MTILTCFKFFIFSLFFLVESSFDVSYSGQNFTTLNSTVRPSNGGSTLPGYMNSTDWDHVFCEQMHCDVGTSVKKEDCEARGQSDGHQHRWLPHGGFSRCCSYCVMLRSKSETLIILCLLTKYINYCTEESEPCFADLDPSNPWPHDHHTCKDDLYCDKTTSRCTKK